MQNVNKLKYWFKSAIISGPLSLTPSSPAYTLATCTLPYKNTRISNLQVTNFTKPWTMLGQKRNRKQHHAWTQKVWQIVIKIREGNTERYKTKSAVNCNVRDFDKQLHQKWVIHAKIIFTPIVTLYGFDIPGVMKHSTRRAALFLSDRQWKKRPLVHKNRFQNWTSSCMVYQNVLMSKRLVLWATRK